ncbi:MAG: orotate phosphoribosyltransferase, partial [Nitrospirae bacterium]|nr:orotate phosphoribosyltransferase [Nitrospirota bacterium]
GLQVVKVIALIDREEADGRRNIEALGVPCDAVFTVKDFGV